MLAEIILRNSKQEPVASMLRNGQTGKWHISTLPNAEFFSLADARRAWDLNFDHETGLPLRFKSAGD
ncbi:MAG TPA: hypothetical protein VJN43_05210 [Bryobacteraceae bacterium]|nr:hypothetical protein [Bryobacteraceae bacterium]